MAAKEVLKKILIVDDSDIQLVVAEGILKAKYDVITAKSGKEALAILAKGLKPDLILLDILMPDMDGWETYNKINGISLLQNVPIAFLTSLSGIVERLRASRLGAADFINKPYDRVVLLEKVEKLLNGERISQDNDKEPQDAP
ncbi:MAG: response regulator [Treponema sp.]|jgi:CheY-like chemotaxis protein|nr:response regulator [Treponema sp.]